MKSVVLKYKTLSNWSGIVTTTNKINRRTYYYYKDTLRIRNSELNLCYNKFVTRKLEKILLISLIKII